MHIKYLLIPGLNDNEIVENVLFHPKENIIITTIGLENKRVQFHKYHYKIDSDLSFEVDMPFASFQILSQFNFCMSANGEHFIFFYNNVFEIVEMVHSEGGFNFYKKASISFTGLVGLIEIVSHGSFFFFTSSDFKLIKVNMIDGQMIECKLSNRIMGLSIDPLNKYICATTADNRIHLLDVIAFKIFKTDDFNQFKQTASKSKLLEAIKMDFSPDLKTITFGTYLTSFPILISLNYSNVIKKTNRFYIKDKSQITCLKYYPAIFYDHNAEYSYIFVGYSDGSINVIQSTPILDSCRFENCIKVNDQGQNVTNIDFSRDGLFMISSSNNQGVMIAFFENYELFNKPKQMSKSELIEEKLQEIELNNENTKNVKTGNRQNLLENGKLNFQKQIPFAQKQQQPKQFYDELGKNGELLITNYLTQGKMITPIQNRQLSISDLTMFNIDEPKIEPDQIFPDHDCYYIYKIYETSTGISCYISGKMIWCSAFDKPLKFIKFNNKLLIAFSTDDHLYFLDTSSGRRIESRVHLEGVFKIDMNSLSDILIVKQNGNLVIFDFMKKKYILKTNILDLLNSNNPLNNASIKLQELASQNKALFFIFGENKMFYIRFLGTYYIYNKWLEQWNKIDESKVKEDKSLTCLKINEIIKINSEIPEGFNLIMNEFEEVHENEGGFLQDKIQKIEERINYSLHVNDFQLFLELMNEYLILLVNAGDEKKLFSLLAENLGEQKSSKESLIFKENGYKKKRFLDKAVDLLRRTCQYDSLCEIIGNFD